MVEAVGESRRQGRLRRRCRGLRSLTAVFRVSDAIVHPDPNPPDCLGRGFDQTCSTNENRPLRVYFAGGSGGSRTHVQEHFRKTFSERIRVFVFCPAGVTRQTTDGLSCLVPLR